LQVFPAAYPANHPNRPIMPFATPSKKATFIDPSVLIKNGNTVVISYQSYIAPYATLNATGGAIKIGNSSDVLDNAVIIANPNHQFQAPQVLIGDQVSIGYGARILGPSTIGGYLGAAKPTAIGARAVIEGATIQPGVIVSPLARVGPGVTVPSGFLVLPGMNVTTNDAASNPKLGMVVSVTSTDTSTVKQILSLSKSLATGYSQLYQGSSATGPNPGANPSLGGINNGNLSTILGVSQEPGPSSVSIEPKKSAPQFATPRGKLVGSLLFNFPARITGLVKFNMRAGQLAQHLGRANAIRADEGQPITIRSIARTGRSVTINSPLGGTLSIGRNFRAATGAVILSGLNVNAKIGNDVTIGAGAVVDRTSLGAGSTVGQGAYLSNSSFPAGTVIPDKAIYLNNQFQGYVQS
jgi:carbonic anhydrase/acetyltransferase-like protein (isoleucine patch superfamily)